MGVYHHPSKTNCWKLFWATLSYSKLQIVPVAPLTIRVATHQNLKSSLTFHWPWISLANNKKEQKPPAKTTVPACVTIKMDHFAQCFSERKIIPWLFTDLNKYCFPWFFRDSGNPDSVHEVYSNSPLNKDTQIIQTLLCVLLLPLLTWFIF